MQIIHYLTADDKDLYQDWLDGLRDMRARVAIQRRVDRLARGNFGDHLFCREAVWELRIDFGASISAPAIACITPRPDRP